jgi:hypothetical protein
MFKVKVNPIEAEEIGRKREKGKTGYKSHRPLSEGYEILGTMGELAFSMFSGLPVDKSVKANGDGGVDFTLPLTIDVKTARKANNLLVEKGKNMADIYVLAQANPDISNEVTLLGWTWGYLVRNAQIDNGDFFGNGVTNFYVPSAELLAMEELNRWLK